jgi:hypothetical protein
MQRTFRKLIKRNFSKINLAASQSLDNPTNVIIVDNLDTFRETHGEQAAADLKETKSLTLYNNSVRSHYILGTSEKSTEM